jgi:GTP cyclohydrolase IB
MKNLNESEASPLVDIQSSPDERMIAIDRVGVRRIKYPICVLDRAKERQHTIGDFTLTVDLPHHFKGTHMSRFLEVLNEHRDKVSVESIPQILEKLRQRLTAETSHLQVEFPFFMTKKAPVTGREGVMEYNCGFYATGGSEEDFVIGAVVPVTTLCPCSKEISARGAHNQRGEVSARLRIKEHVWLEEIIETIESCASCELYPVLKRPDEKWVTEKAYDTPRFVEDMVREVALAFHRDDRILSYEIEVENFESIHAHNAYAYLKRDKRGQASTAKTDC